LREVLGTARLTGAGGAGSVAREARFSLVRREEPRPEHEASGEDKLDIAPEPRPPYARIKREHSR
jgi:hypothetical protein